MKTIYCGLREVNHLRNFGIASFYLTGTTFVGIRRMPSKFGNGLLADYITQSNNPDYHEGEEVEVRLFDEPIGIGK